MIGLAFQRMFQGEELPITVRHFGGIGTNI
jgi:hypothetical protein